MVPRKAEDVLDDLDHYVHEAAMRLGFDVGWRVALPLVEEARASGKDAVAFIDARLAQMAPAKAA